MSKFALEIEDDRERRSQLDHGGERRTGLLPWRAAGEERRDGRNETYMRIAADRKEGRQALHDAVYDSLQNIQWFTSPPGPVG